MSEQRQSIDEIFLAAMEMADDSVRNAYLEKACNGDQALRVRIDKLLRAVPQVGAFLEEPAFSPSNLADRNSPISLDLSGQSFGPYKLLEKIGEGGMGTVYLAQQDEPVQRRVALKVIRTGMDTSQVIARFEHERQALALMDHPNITRVLDAGATANGLPYFAMELVHGIPITKYCDQEHLSVDERIDLLIPICQAVQHAHQKGIVHRDLKPSNVLVALYDGRPIPKVIDFGVAKATAQPLTQRTLFTDLGQMVGTLEYMAPEQAETNNLDIDTRADIYSLGVLLYELLTGSPPFTAEELRSAGMAGMLRMVQEVEPAKPSTKISSSEDLPRVAANRKLEPRKLANLVRGELDWISLKCLEKDRTRRYETANDLASDLQRYLSNEPVQACLPTVRYRLGKFLRRNRGPVFAATLLLLALIAGVVGTSIGLIRARQSHAATEQQRDRAERHHQRAMAAVDRLLTRVGGVGLEAVPHMDDTRRRILEDALEFYREILQDESDDPVVRREIGLALQRIGAIQTDLERHQEAVNSFNRAIEVHQSLASDSPDNPDDEVNLVRSHRQLAFVLFKSAQVPEAERIVDSMIGRNRIETPVGRNEQFLLFFLQGRIFASTQRRDEAIMVCLQALKLDVGQEPGEAVSDVQMDRASLLGMLGSLYADNRQFDEAEECFRESNDAWERMLKAEPENIRVQRGLGLLRVNSGLALANSDQLADARAEYDKAIAILAPLARDHPSMPNYSWDLAKAYNNSALLHSKNNDPAQAATENVKVVKLFEDLMQRYPQRPEFVGSYSGSCSNQGKYLLDQQQWAESVVWNSKAIVAADQFLKVEPRHTETRRYLHSSLIGRAGAYRRLNQMELAIKDYRRSLEISEGEPNSSYARFRPRALAFVGEHAKAAVEAESIVTNANATSSNFNEMAKVYATCFEAAGKETDQVDVELAERYAVRSVELLAKAAEKGHYEMLEDVTALRSDDRLQPLQNREDFKKLLLDLEQSLQLLPNPDAIKSDR
ncbi:MAG: serine/threonine-protein kinase [Pirellulaceae bacterium]